jgi:hypothetical protein
MPQLKRTLSLAKLELEHLPLDLNLRTAAWDEARKRNGMVDDNRAKYAKHRKEWAQKRGLEEPLSLNMFKLWFEELEQDLAHCTL